MKEKEPRWNKATNKGEEGREVRVSEKQIEQQAMADKIRVHIGSQTR